MCRVLTCVQGSHSVSLMRKSKNYQYLWILVSGLLLLPVSGYGAEIGGLYEAEVRVYSQKRSERATAMAVALAEVLVKVSGHRGAAVNQGVAKAIRKPARFLQQYRYQALPADIRKKELEIAGSEADPQILFFRFDKAAVDKMLRGNDLPVWGATRPATLGWIAVQDENHRYLVASGAVEPMRELIMRESQRRGLALLLPLMDLQDQMALRFADVWGGFYDPITKASSRYRAESVLIGRLYRPIGGEWQAQWTLLEGGKMQSWVGQGALSVEVVDEGVSGAVEVLASRYAPIAGGGQAGLLAVMVTDVRTLNDYARVSRYLRSLQQVEQLHVSRVEANQITYELDVEGGPGGIAKTIALGNVLILKKQPQNEAGDSQVSWSQSYLQSQTPVYRLLP